MNKDQKNLNRHAKRNYSIEEKENYCIAWKKSGTSQVEFCKENRISRSAFYKWSKEFKEEEASCFAPLVLDQENPIDQGEVIQLKVILPNKIHLKLTMPKYCLASFIKDIGYETTVIR
jgi:hypothetical protein